MSSQTTLLKDSENKNIKPCINASLADAVPPPVNTKTLGKFNVGSWVP